MACSLSGVVSAGCIARPLPRRARCQKAAMKGGWWALHLAGPYLARERTLFVSDSGCEFAIRRPESHPESLTKVCWRGAARARRHPLEPLFRPQPPRDASHRQEPLDDLAEDVGVENAWVAFDALASEPGADVRDVAL